MRATFSPLMGSAGDDVIVPGWVTPGTTGGAPGASDDTFFASWGYDTLDGGRGQNAYLAGESIRLMMYHGGGPAGAFPVMVFKADAGAWFLGVDLLANFSIFQGGLLEDQLRLGPQDDTLDGGPGADVLDGGDGQDMVAFLDAGPAGVLVDLHAGYATDPWGDLDLLVSIEDAEGTALADTLLGDPSSNTLSGLAGDDLLDGRGGGDLLRGGRGDDRYRIRDLRDRAVETADEGMDRAEIHVSGWALTPGSQVEVLQLMVPGSMTGNDLGQTLLGTASVDLLTGGAGNDTLDGVAGADTLIGGAGNDTYMVRDLATVLTEAPGEGRDTALVTVDDWQAGAGLEVLRLLAAATRLRGPATGAELFANAALGSTLEGGAGDDVLWGTALTDTLLGGAGNDVVLGGGSQDWLAGGLGDDLYVLTDVAALVVERPGEGRDTAWLLGAGDWRLSPHIEVVFMGGAAGTLTGSAGDDLILGNMALANSIHGGEGDDQIYGGALSDTLWGGAGNDAFLGRGGGDLMIGGPGNDLYVITDMQDVMREEAGGGLDAALVLVPEWRASEGIEAIWLGAGAFRVRGSNTNESIVALADSVAWLEGGGGDDVIFGSRLADVLSGGLGDDIIVTGGGADRLVCDAPGFGHDHVFGLALGSVLDFRGSGVTGREDLLITDLTWVTRLETPAGVMDFHGSPAWAVAGLEMWF